MSATDSNNTKGATANAVASSDMVWPEWTHDTPTESGYYWWQHDPKCVPFVVEVRPFVDGTKEALFPWGNMILLDRKSIVRWAGPIPLPRCHTDIALAQSPRESAGDTPRIQVTPHVETEGEGGCCQQRLVLPLVLLEDRSKDEVAWSVSFDGPNPPNELCVHCASRDEAVKLKLLIEERITNEYPNL